MCNNPVIDHDGNTIWCRKCERCRRVRINDWVGRCIAESRHASTTHSVTLTYGRDESGNEDHVHAAVLVYSDVQKYFKSLRRAGFKFKYLCAGEYGSKKRRAHWHVILFWDGPAPEVELNKNHHHVYWPHGHTFWEPMTYKSVLYVCKYLQKPQGDDEGEAMLRMSKKPPLGHEWFQKWARQHVEQGLAPRSLHYSFADVRHKDGKAKEVYMQGVTADNFLEEYCRYFVHAKGHTRMPGSELVEEFIDKRYAEYFEQEKWMREKGYGETIVEAFKKDVLEKRAAPLGGIKIFLPSCGAGREAVALCRDNTVLTYGDTSETENELFLKAVCRAE